MASKINVSKFIRTRKSAKDSINKMSSIDKEQYKLWQKYGQTDSTIDSLREHTATETQTSDLADNLYLHSNSKSYSIRKNQNMVSLKGDIYAGINILIQKQKAREKEILKSFEQLGVSSIKEGKIELTNDMLNKIFSPTNGNDYASMANKAGFDGMFSKTLDKISSKGGIQNFSNIANELRNEFTSIQDNINNGYIAAISPMALKDLFSFPIIKTLQNAKKKYEKEATADNSTKDISKKIWESVGPGYMGYMLEGGLITRYATNELLKSTGIIARPTGAKTAQSLLTSRKVQIKTDIMMVTPGFDDINTIPVGISAKNYSNMDQISFNNALKLDDIIKILQQLGNSDDIVSTLSNKKFQYEMINDETQNGFYTGQNPSSDILNYILNVLRTTIAFQIGNALNSDGTADTQNDFIALGTSFFPASYIMEEALLSNNAVTRIDSVQEIDLSSLTEEKRSLSRESVKSAAGTRFEEMWSIYGDSSKMEKFYAQQDVSAGYYPSAVLALGSRFGKIVKESMKFKLLLKGSKILKSLN